MSKGARKGPKPLTCSRSACKKKWANSHMRMNCSSYGLRSEENLIIKQNPDAWDDYFDIE